MSRMERIKEPPYSKLETLSPEERRDHQWTRLNQVLDVAAERSEEFIKRMEQAGMDPDDIASLEDFASIPTFNKKQLISLQQESGLKDLLTLEPGELSRVYMSPGPIFDPEGRGKDYWGWTEGFFAAGFRSGDLVQMTFSYHLTPAGLMLEEPLRELGCAVIPAGPGNTDVQLELMTRLPVTGFVGMASYLKIIKDKALKQGLDVKKDLKLEAAFVAAERLAPSLREELEQEMDMLVRQGYGTADLGCAAYECSELTGMHVSSRCYVEICDPKTGQPLPVGETGEVVVTPFTTDYPLVRLATGDLAYLVDDPCACGRTSARIGAIVGRVDSTAKIKGQFLYPHQVSEVVDTFDTVEKWQLVVDNKGGRETLVMRLRVSGYLESEGFLKAFQEKLKLRPKLDLIDSEDDLPDDAPALVDNRTFE
ncbi:MAG: phenylacetate--CoA ligase family protein [Desulfovibrio sp.]|nr:MAG: phenylacetate--CoA ligase family protein [Desulfovibrio sp.]